MTNSAKEKERKEADVALDALRHIFAFGVPGGRSKIQKRIGRYLDGDDAALDGAPTIKARIDKGMALARTIQDE